MVSFCSLWFRLEGFHSFVWRASLYFCLEGFPFVWRVFLLGMAKMRQNHASRHEYVHYPHHSAFTASAWPCPVHPFSLQFCLESFPTVGASLHQEVVTQRILEVINFWHFDWPIHHALWCSYDHHHRTYYKSASIILLDWIDREWHWGFQFQRNLLLVVTKIFLVVVDHH